MPSAAWCYGIGPQPATWARDSGAVVGRQSTKALRCTLHEYSCPLMRLSMLVYAPHIALLVQTLRRHPHLQICTYTFSAILRHHAYTVSHDAKYATQRLWHVRLPAFAWYCCTDEHEQRSMYATHLGRTLGSKLLLIVLELLGACVTWIRTFIRYGKLELMLPHALVFTSLKLNSDSRI